MCTFNLLYILTDVFFFFFSEHLMLNLSSITYDDNFFFFFLYSIVQDYVIRMFTKVRENVWGRKIEKLLISMRFGY